VPECLFDCLALAKSGRYAKLDCCAMDISDDKLPKALCALCALLDVALVSPTLSSALLNDAENLDAYLSILFCMFHVKLYVFNSSNLLCFSKINFEVN